MNENIEMLKHIYKSSKMGHSSSEDLLEALKEKDNKIKKTLEEINKEYEKFEKESHILLKKNKVKLENSSIMAEIMSKLGIKKEVKNDNSDSSIAGTLIEGLTMGSIEIEKKISDYEKDIDRKILNLAKDYKKFQDNYTKKLKEFL